MRHVIIILCMFLTACHQDFTPRQVVLAKEYCKANGMEYYVETQTFVGYAGATNEVKYYHCKDVDGLKYSIPDSAVRHDKEK